MLSSWFVNTLYGKSGKWSCIIFIISELMLNIIFKQGHPGSAGAKGIQGIPGAKVSCGFTYVI